MSDPLGLFSDEPTTSKTADPLGLFDDDDNKPKAGLGTALASSFAGVGNTVDTAGSMLLGAGKSLFGNTEGADSTYRAMEQRNKDRMQWANPDNQELDLTGKIVGTAATLPMQMLGGLVSPFETGKQLSDNGESLGTALGGVGVSTLGNAVGMAVPGAMGGALATRIGSGAALNAGQTVAQQAALQQIAQTEASKKQFAPNLDDAIVAGVVGGGFGAMPNSARPVSADIAPTTAVEAPAPTRLNPEDIQRRIDELAAPKVPESQDPLGLFNQEEPVIVPRLDEGETPLPVINEAIPVEIPRLPEESTPFPTLENMEVEKPSHVLKQEELGLRDPNEPIIKETTLNREDFGPSEIGANETAIPSRLVDPYHGAVNVEGLLDHFVQNSVDPGYQSLAQALKGKLGDVDVAISMKNGQAQEFHTNPAGAQVRGTYSPTVDLIMLGKKGMTDRVFLHEAVHAATAKFLRAMPDSEGAVALNALYQKMLPLANDAGLLARGEDGKLTNDIGYGFHNVDEFVAEAMTNRGLQEWLKTHTIDGQRYVPQSKLSSAWDTFKQAIGRLLGLDARAYTALDNVMDIASDIIDTNNTYRDAVNVGFNNYVKDVLKAKNVQSLNAPPEAVRSTNDVLADNAKALAKLAEITPTFDVNIAENIPLYRTEKDISNDNNSLKSGTQFTSLLNNKNALVRDVGRVFRSALNEARKVEADYLTNSSNGVIPLRNKLSKNEFTDLQMVLRAAEGKADLSPSQMRELGLNEKQIAVAQKMRQTLDDTLVNLNEVLVSKGMSPIERRNGYLPGTFKGDFRTVVTDANGKFVSVIADNNRRTMEKIVSKMREQDPSLKFDVADKQTNANYRDRDSFAAFEQALAIVGDNSPEAQRVQAMYQDYKSQSAFNSTSTKKHFMDKKGGDTGAEGFKAWESDAVNAKEGFRSFVDYIETANKWVSVNKAVEKVAPAITDPAVIKAQPNAVSYLNKYINTVQGKPNQEFLYGLPHGVEKIVDGVFNLIADNTGLGPTTLKAPFNELAKYTQLAWMGMRPVFSAVQMLQYAVTLPRKFSEFTPFNAIRSELAGYASSAKMLAQLNHSIRMGKKGIEVDGSSIRDPFDRDMYRYMVDTGLITQSVLMDVRTLDQPAWVNKAQDVMSINMRIPEILTRTAAFATFAQNYKNLGLSNRAAFEKAMEATDFTMGNYKPEERPLLYQQGWLTQKAGALQTYKHNQIGQIRSYFQDAKSGKPTGLALYALTTLAMGGIIGLPAMEQADALADKLSMMLFKKPFSVKRWLMTNVPEIYTRGAVTNLTRNLVPEGIDLGSSMSAADLLGSGAEGYITDNYKKVQALVQLVTADTSTERAQAARDLVPMQFRGTIENNYLSKPIYEKDEYGNIKATGDKLTATTDLQGDVIRSPMEQTLRSWGATSVNERNTKDLNFAAKNEETAKNKLRAGAVDKLANLYYSGRLTDNMDEASKKVYTKAYQQYINNGGDPSTLQKAIANEAMNQNTTTLNRNIGKPKSIRSIDKAQTYMEGR